MPGAIASRCGSGGRLLELPELPTSRSPVRAGRDPPPALAASRVADARKRGTAPARSRSLRGCRRPSRVGQAPRGPWAADVLRQAVLDLHDLCHRPPPAPFPKRGIRFFGSRQREHDLLREIQRGFFEPSSLNVRPLSSTWRKSIPNRCAIAGRTGQPQHRAPVSDTFEGPLAAIHPPRTAGGDARRVAIDAGHGARIRSVSRGTS